MRNSLREVLGNKNYRWIHTELKSEIQISKDLLVFKAPTLFNYNVEIEHTRFWRTKLILQNRWGCCEIPSHWRNPWSEGWIPFQVYSTASRPLSAQRVCDSFVQPQSEKKNPCSRNGISKCITISCATYFPLPSRGLSYIVWYFYTLWTHLPSHFSKCLGNMVY